MEIPADAHTRKTFYVGGEYVTDSSGRHFLRGQVYVEHLTPVCPGRQLHENPLVLIHGGGRTGDFLTKPDGQPGWASFFLARGYEVYIIDQAFRGRSPWHPDAGKYLTFSAEMVEATWTRPATSDPPLWPSAGLHTQWSGPGTRGDPVFDGTCASMAPNLDDFALQEGTTQKACAALVDRIGKPVVLVAHSLGCLVAWLVADVRPAQTKGVVAVEPSGPPFSGLGVAGPRAKATEYGVTYAPITYDPPVGDPQRDLTRATLRSAGLQDVFVQADEPPPRRLVNLAEIPVAVVTAEASKHALYDWGTVAFLRQAGVSQTEHIVLGDRGIHGNGHMLLAEENSDVVAEEIVRWVEKL